MKAVVQNGYGAPSGYPAGRRSTRRRSATTTCSFASGPRARTRRTGSRSRESRTSPATVRASWPEDAGAWNRRRRGREAVGGNVTDLQPGDEVLGSAWTDSFAMTGTFAELTVSPADRLIRKPAGLTFEEAAASVMSALTALLAVRDASRGSGRGRRFSSTALPAASARSGQAVREGAGCGGHRRAARGNGAGQAARRRPRRRLLAGGLHAANGATTSSSTTCSTTRPRRSRGRSPPAASSFRSVGNSGGLLAGLPRMAARR